MRCETPGLLATIAARTSSQFSWVSLSPLVQYLFNIGNMVKLNQTQIKKIKHRNDSIYSKFGSSLYSQSKKNTFFFTPVVFSFQKLKFCSIIKKNIAL
jgi:hypothetical protein